MKKHICISILFLALVNIAFAQNAVGRMTINFKDPLRSGGTTVTGAVQMPGTGRDIATELFYPASTNGTNVPLASGQFPVVVFGHGFVMGYESYNNISNELAQKGFIVALPRTEGSFSPNHLEFGKDIAFVASELLKLNTASTPAEIMIFNGKVLSRVALSGHSMGGGCSLVGAQNNTTISCVFNMAAATSNTAGVSSLAGSSLVTVPALLFSGERDCVVDTNIQSAHYQALASSEKFHVILKDLSHCDFGTGTNFNCTFGQTTSGCSNTINNTLAHTRYMNYLVPFLNRYLNNQCSAGQNLMDSLISPSAYRVGRKITGTAICAATGIKKHGPEEFMLFPIPTKNNLTIKSINGTTKIQNIVLLDIGLQEIETKALITDKGYTVCVSGLSAGIYIIKWRTDDDTYFRKVIIEN